MKILTTLGIVICVFSNTQAQSLLAYTFSHGAGTFVDTAYTVDYLIGQYIYLGADSKVVTGFEDIIVLIQEEILETTTLPAEIVEFKVFPNPSQDYINVELEIKTNAFSDLKMSIHNIAGMLLFQKDWKIQSGFNTNQINISNYPSATYLLTVEAKDKSFFKSYRVIKN